MMAHPLALQPRNLQSLMEIGVDRNTTVVFPAPLMSTIEELGGFLARGAAAVTTPAPPQPSGAPTVQTPAVGGPKALTERPPLVDFDEPVGPAFWDRSKR